MPGSSGCTALIEAARQQLDARAFCPEAVADAGAIDVLVNNAGIGWLNAVEGTSMAVVHRIFETNTFAVIAMMQAVLPGMRERRAGVIVNVSSSVTIKPLPLLSVYRASKAAVNALTEAAALELAPFFTCLTSTTQQASSNLLHEDLQPPIVTQLR